MRLFWLTMLLCLFPCFSQWTGEGPGFLHQQGCQKQPLPEGPRQPDQVKRCRQHADQGRQKPNLTFTGNLYYAPVINSWGYSEAITNGGNFITLLNVSQPLFNNKTLKTKYEGIDLQHQSLANSAKIAEIDLKKDIVDQYLSAYSALSTLNFNRDALRYMHDEDTVLQELVTKGYFRETDYLSFLVEMGNMELAQTDQEVQFHREVSALNLLCGVSDEEVNDLARPVVPVTSPGAGYLSPRFQRFSIDSLAIENERALIDTRYKPVLSWQSDAGIVNNVPADLYKNLGVSIGLNFSLPVYDGEQRKLNYAKLRYNEETRQGYLLFFRQQYSQHLKQLHDELASVEALVPKLKNQMKLADEVIRQNKVRLNYGSISITDYIISLKNYIAIQSNLQQAEIRVMRITNEINYWNQ